MPDAQETPAEQADGEAPPKKTPSRKSKAKSKKNIPKPEEPKEEMPAPSPITHEPVVMADSAMPPPQPTPSVGQLHQTPRIRDFWVCWGLLLIFAVVCGIGFAILHTTRFAKDGQDKFWLMQAMREMGTHGAILGKHGNPNYGDSGSGSKETGNTTAPAAKP